ncbi:MAG: thiol:disulfide interchange protein DsbA/DsbL [Lautropia sp.]|nr:thiol:disulfide interchange protein DsbA/DsbL [Lautropia sp.]
MDRKQFLSTAVSAAVLAALPLSGAWGQPSGSYSQVSGRVPTEAPAGKIEVVEFFWYGCPHCYSFEPVIEAWSKTLPEDVVLRRVHVPFFGLPHQQLFYALQAIGREDGKTRDALFRAIQKDGKKLQKVDDMVAVLEPAGVDAKAFKDAYNSFGVKTQMQRANKLASAYGIDGVPTLGVNGKYLTGPSMSGSNQAAIQVLNQLIARERRAKGG